MGLTRRAFLGAAAAAAAARALPPIGGQATGPAPGASLWWRAHHGLAARFGGSPALAYRTRLVRELAVIARLGCAETFLFVDDVVRMARQREIALGPGRGSAPSSLVCWALGITDVDPLQHGLHFERFLNWRRPGAAVPDIDLDVCALRRDELVAHVSAAVGRERVAFALRGDDPARSALRRAGHAVGVPWPEIVLVTGLVPAPVHDRQLRLRRLLTSEPELARRRAEDERGRRWFARALALEAEDESFPYEIPGVHRATTLVIGDRPLEEVAGCFVDEQGRRVVKLDADEAARRGLYTLDCMRLRAVTLLDVAGVKLGAPDARAYALIAGGDTEGVFPLESPPARDLVRRIRPEGFEDVVAAVALDGSGPLADAFVARRHGGATYHLEPALAPVLGPTYGLVLYQEQVMDVARVVAGYDLAEADLFRRALGKRKPAELERAAAGFVARAGDRRFGRRAAVRLFDELLEAVGEARSRAHAAAWATLAARTAWLAAHAPRAFARARRLAGDGTAA